MVSNSNSNSSNSSSTYGNKDRENWVSLHNKLEVVIENVRGIDKTIGVKYKGYKMNQFNLLSNEGRREWRAEEGVGGLDVEAEGRRGVGDGC